MRRAFSLLVIAALLGGATLGAAYAEKTPKVPKVPKTPKTEAQIESYARNHPDPATPSDPGGRRPGSSVYGSPYTRAPWEYSNPGADLSHRPYQPSRPSTRIDDDRDRWRYAYPEPRRAYAYPPRSNWNSHHRYDDDRRHAWAWQWGPSLGWSSGWGWDWGLGYFTPAPYVVAVPYAVPASEPAYDTYEETPAARYYVPAIGSPTQGPVGSTPPEKLPLLGCDILAGDRTFLGVIDREYDSAESIANHEGRFGSPKSPASIWNPDTAYGSPTGLYSPWNPECSRPPMLTWHGAFKGYLTNNPAISPAISPDVLAKEIQASPWR